MQRITTDHTIEQEFIAAGVAPEIAGKFSHMLTRCLGYETHQRDGPTSISCGCSRAISFCMCTDGLTDMVRRRANRPVPR